MVEFTKSPALEGEHPPARLERAAGARRARHPPRAMTTAEHHVCVVGGEPGESEDAAPVDRRADRRTCGSPAQLAVKGWSAEDSRLDRAGPGQCVRRASGPPGRRRRPSGPEETDLVNKIRQCPATANAPPRPRQAMR